MWNLYETFELRHLGVRYEVVSSIFGWFQNVSPPRKMKILKKCTSNFFPQNMLKKVTVSFFWYPLLIFWYKSICRPKITIFRFLWFFRFISIFFNILRYERLSYQIFEKFKIILKTSSFYQVLVLVALFNFPGLLTGFCNHQISKFKMEI